MSAPASYEEFQKIQEQIAALQAKSKALHDALIADEVKAIKAKIKELGLKPRDLFSAAVLSGEGDAAPMSMGEKIAKASKSKEPAEVKYRGPNGETWGGGRGRKPGWVQAILDAGGDIEKYKV
jgi:DNA-binding protein H-NS